MGNLKEAKREIARSKVNGAHSLSLDNYSLTTEDLKYLIPIINKELPNLKELILEQDKIDTIPLEIQELRSLERLNLSQRDQQYLPRKKSLDKPQKALF